MATIKVQGKQESLPKAPRQGNPTYRSWGEKTNDQVARLRKQAKELLERVGRAPAAAHEALPKLLESVGVAAEAFEEAWEHADKLGAAKFNLPKSAGGGARVSAKLEVGSQVCLRKAIWVRKYAGLMRAEQLDGLTVERLQGKLALARSESGIVITEPISAFTTRLYSYEDASAAE